MLQRLFGAMSMRRIGLLALAMMSHAGAAGMQGAAPDAMPRPAGEHGCDPVQLAALAARIDLLERRLAALTAPPAAREVSSDKISTSAASASAAAAPPSAPADEPMARALERALVREGGLVLPPGAVELEPRFRYQHRSTQQLELLNVGGQTAVAQVDRKLDQSQLTLGWRFGLPGSSQLELLLPYASHRMRTIAADSSGASIGTGAGAIAVTDNASGIGNIDIGWTKQWYTRPGGSGALASVRVSEPVSANQAGSSVAVGSSFRTLQGSLLFIHRVDPVVYVGGLSYAANLARRIAGVRIDPGDAIAMRAGALIALSPDTSLRLGLDLSRTRDTSVDGVTLAGSAAVVGEFSTGFSFVLTPRTLLGIEAGIGLTPRSPDFRIGLSLPIRF